MNTNDQNLYTDFLLKQAEFFAVEVETTGKLLAQNNLPLYEATQVTISRLADQIDRNQALVQSYLHKAVTEIGQNSQSAQLLIKTAEQQVQVVDWLKGLNSAEIQKAAETGSNVVKGTTQEIIGKAGGAFLDTAQILVNLSKTDYTGAMQKGLEALVSGLAAAAVVALLPAEVPVAIAAGLVALSATILSDLAGDAFKSFDVGAKIIDFTSRNIIPPTMDGLSKLLDFFITPAGANADINPLTATQFTAAEAAAPPKKDPLVLDLDNDGLETTGLNATKPIYFDQNADGVKTATGWVSADDAFLVLDKNANGTIDNGRELFGDSTLKSNGQLATDGFDALRDLDANADGKVDAGDAQFANLRLWRDLNQDGISQADELFTLDSQNIAAINVGSTEHSQILANGNQLADLGSFVKTDGSSGTLGEVSGNLGDINLVQDTFHSQFTDTLDTSTVAALPDMQGAGQVRNLREAATLSPVLAQLLTDFAAATTRDAQQALLEPILKAWSDTSLMATTFTGAYTGHALTVNGLPVAGTADRQARENKISLLERFNGRTFNAVPGTAANNETWRMAA